MTLAGGVEHQKVESAVWEVFNRLKSAGPNPDDLKRAVEYTSAQNAYSLSSVSGLLSHINEAIARGDWKDAFRYEEYLRTATPDDVRKTANDYLTKKTLTVGHLFAI